MDKTDIHTFGNFYIPPRMMGGIERYIENGVPPGSFLTAIICNNLKEAVAKADDENIRNIPAYVDYFYNKAPRDCWGSYEKMDFWIKQKQNIQP